MLLSSLVCGCCLQADGVGSKSSRSSPTPFLFVFQTHEAGQSELARRGESERKGKGPVMNMNSYQDGVSQNRDPNIDPKN